MVIHARAKHSDRQDTGETTKAHTCANTSNTASLGRLTSDGNSSGSSNDSSSSSNSSSSMHSNRQKTATDGDLGDAEISLHTQYQDIHLANIIKYLQHGELPDDNKIARRLLLTKDNLAIRDDKLIHIGVKRRKNNGTDQPIMEQLCIPEALQLTILARYHAQLMHCGYEKMYLTLKGRVYWDNMYTDICNYVA